MKYIITKANGRPINPKARYFVLRLDDKTKPDYKAAKKAILLYANQVARECPEMALAARVALCGPEFDVKKFKKNCQHCGSDDTRPRTSVGFEGERHCNCCGGSWDVD